MKTLNLSQIIGFVGNDPKIYAMPSGTLVARFSVATEEIYKEKKTQEIIKNTEWHPVVLLGFLAELAERFVQKGTSVYISGKRKTREYEDAEKIVRSITELVGDDINVLADGKRDPGTDEPIRVPLPVRIDRKQDRELTRDTDTTTTDNLLLTGDTDAFEIKNCHGTAKD